MKKFIFKTFLFFPFLLVYLFTSSFYSDSKGDLLRMGLIIDLYPNYREIFKTEFENKLKFDRLSKIDKNKEYKILVVGDSFSEQGNFGYQNYIDSEKYGNLLHLDRVGSSNNQIQLLYSIINGDFLEKHPFEYIILQSVERNFIIRGLAIDSSKTTTSLELEKLVLASKSLSNKKESSFLSRADLEFPYYSFKYILGNDALFNKDVYRVNLVESKFSIERNEFLFLSEDLERIEINNKLKNIKELNRQLNEIDKALKEKGITLVVVPSPDKFSLYYPFIADKSKFTEPLFFEKLSKLDKKYLYIDSKKVLFEALSDSKDIYFYDDSHWSPFASKIMAKEIEKIIDKDRENKTSSTTTPQ